MASELTDEERDTLRYWCSIDGDHAMKRRVLRLLGEHRQRGDQINMLKRLLSEARERIAELERRNEVLNGRNNQLTRERDDAVHARDLECQRLAACGCAALGYLTDGEPLADGVHSASLQDVFGLVRERDRLTRERDTAQKDAVLALEAVHADMETTMLPDGGLPADVVARIDSYAAGQPVSGEPDRDALVRAVVDGAMAVRVCDNASTSPTHVYLTRQLEALAEYDRAAGRKEKP